MLPGGMRGSQDTTVIDTERLGPHGAHSGTVANVSGLPPKKAQSQSGRLPRDGLGGFQDLPGHFSSSGNLSWYRAGVRLGARQGSSQAEWPQHTSWAPGPDCILFTWAGKEVWIGLICLRGEGLEDSR